jgi:hypothetical protein
VARGNTRITPRPSTKENNVYAAPDGNVLRKTPQGWQQRAQNTWKDAGQTPANQGAVARDQEVRQRAAERTTSFRTPPPAQPAPKAQPKPEKAAEKRKEDKKR